MYMHLYMYKCNCLKSHFLSNNFLYFNNTTNNNSYLLNIISNKL